MRRGSFVRATLVLAMVAGALVVSTGPASAHGSGVILVPRQLSGRPDLRLDGSCEPDYPRSGNGRTLLYRPDFEAPPATFALITTADALWVGVRAVTRGPESAAPLPSMPLVSDPRHDGGAAPDLDDVAFALGEN